MTVVKYIADTFKEPATRKVWPWVIVTPFAFILGNYLAVAKIGSQFFLVLETPFVLGLLGALLAIFILPFFLFSRKWRRTASAWLLVCVIFIPMCFAGIVAGDKIRMSAFYNLASKSKPLVSAIHEFTNQTGLPPSSLDALVPDYINEIPKTGMMAYSKYRYYVGEDAIRYEGNPWVLRVFTPSGGINFDEFMYFPLQNYPERGYGGSFQKIQDWAYLHE